MSANTLTPAQFADFSEIIATQLGIKMPPSKQTMLQSRLHRRLRELGLDSFEEYHDKFFNDAAHRAEELEHLLNLATTNKTDFFREPDHFDLLVQQILPAWLRRPTGPVFRVWCAGCSTGEEAYTIAMTLLEAQTAHRFDFAIRATDVCTRVLDTAMQAIYPAEHIKPVPPSLRAKYLLRSRDRADDRVRIAPAVRAKVRFGHLNFLAPDFGLPETLDVIFFRNVMIYFDRDTQQQVVSRMCRHLHVGATLFIAHAETLQGLPLPLRNAGPSVYRHEPAAAKP
jgi:chemotaxis protein methyltransferase CheR